MEYIGNESGATPIRGFFSSKEGCLRGKLLHGADYHEGKEREQIAFVFARLNQSRHKRMQAYQHCLTRLQSLRWESRLCSTAFGKAGFATPHNLLFLANTNYTLSREGLKAWHRLCSTARYKRQCITIGVVVSLPARQPFPLLVLSLIHI